ncbi:MAG: nitroreductase family protein [Solirubrobacteraceae bacterium]|nr:nitroreductase family protein [Solirubrobacteraceae bacterium]
MELEEAIRNRRTHKAYGPEPVDPEVLAELLDLARWAPNHNLTNPWRFRVLGPGALDRLERAAGPEAGPKLRRAPTLVAVSVLTSPDPVAAAEDRDASAIAAYIVLLAAHGRGLAGYWRTPAVLREPAGREALRIDEGELVLGLLHLGTPRHEPRAPRRAPAQDVVTWLD